MSSDKTKDPERTFAGKMKNHPVVKIYVHAPTKVAQPGRADQTPAKDRNNKGSTYRRRRDEDVILRKKTTPVQYINFYDLGQIKDGDSWNDLSFVWTPTITGTAIAKVVNPEFVEADWNDLFTEIFTVPVSSWKDNYRKLGLEDAERYGVDVAKTNDDFALYAVARDGSRFDYYGNPISGSVWTSQGLHVPDPLDAFEVVNWQAFVNFNNNSGTYKITNGPSYSDAEVAFTLGPKADVFLVPTIVPYMGQSKEAGGGGADTDTFIGDFRAYQRSFWLNRNYDSGRPILSNPGGESITGATATAIIAHIKEGSPQAWQRTNPGGPTITSDPNNFPLYSGTVRLHYGPAATSVGLHSLPSIFTDGPRYFEGMFCGLIKQDGLDYYFWAKSSGGQTGPGEIQVEI